MKRHFAFGIALLLIIALILAGGCSKTEPDKKLMEEPLRADQKTSTEDKETVARPSAQITDIELITEDGITLMGTLYEPPKKSRKGIVLLHMLDHDRHTWDGFAEKMAAMGYSALSVDLRGHGESQGNWKDFSDSDFVKMTYDAKAAADHLRSEGATKLFVAGASIGANTALNYAATYDNVAGVILLSPGKDYRGIETISAAKELRAPILIVASEGDSYSAASSKELYRLITSEKKIEIIEGNAHGTDMLSADEKLEENIVQWILDH